MFRGQPLIRHVADALQPQCDRLVIAGRTLPGFTCLADVPASGLGPLGGVCAAMQHGRAHGFDEIICAPCDLLSVPPDAVTRLSPGPSVACRQWLLGLWPTQLAGHLSDFLKEHGAAPVRSYAAAVSARHVPMPGLVNVNRPEDLPRG
jgi:molybdopterin-guanine dinucleotide biosynthesis protein A